jgi:hypothetical protein
MSRIRIAILTLLGPMLIFGAAHRMTGAKAQQAAQPMLLMSALQLPDTTRYTVTIANPTQTTLGDLQLAVQLPADAVFDHALETPGYTQFQGAQDGTLSWTGTSFAPTDEIDAFTFFLQQPTSGSFSVTASWDSGSVQGQFSPAPQAATDSETDVTLDAGSLAAGVVPVGNTGVVILGPSGTLPAGTTLHVQVLGATANPPAGTGDLWWCAIVRIDGLPDGAGVVVLVPARQPLPPGAAINLFAQQGDQWTPLDRQAGVTGDGQFIQYLHTGGVVASGTNRPNQPFSAGTVVSNTGLGGRIATQNAVSVQAQLNTFLDQMQQPARNCNTIPGNPCKGLPPCNPGAFLPSNPANRSVGPSGVVPCANAAFNGDLTLDGRTTCHLNGLTCSGSVPFQAMNNGTVNAFAGHGTICTFQIFDPSTRLFAAPGQCTPF